MHVHLGQEWASVKITALSFCDGLHDRCNTQISPWCHFLWQDEITKPVMSEVTQWKPHLDN